MTPKEARRLVGRTIRSVDLGGYWDEHHGDRRYMHDPTIELDNGTRIRFMVEESPSASHYGVDLIAVCPPKKAPSPGRGET